MNHFLIPSPATGLALGLGLALAFMLFSALPGCAGRDRHAHVTSGSHAAPAATPVQPATLASAYPAPQEPLDHTPITPVESAGASHTE